MKDSLSIKRTGFAVGATCGLFYLGCVIVMLTVPQDAVVRFFNSGVHGWDVEPIMPRDMPWWEAVFGVVEVFVLGWLFGALTALFYNMGAATHASAPAGEEASHALA